MLWLLITYAVASTITPGPNNLMLFASGANFGLRRSVRHIFGISLGHIIMIGGLSLGLAQVFAVMPAAYTVLKICSAIYMTYLAYKIATAAPPSDVASTTTPMTLWQAAAFQWVNPKAWAMHLNALTLFAPPEAGWLGFLTVIIVIPLINTPCATVWAVLGSKTKRWLDAPRRLRVFNITMALTLIASILPILRENVPV